MDRRVIILVLVGLMSFLTVSSQVKETCNDKNVIIELNNIGKCKAGGKKTLKAPPTKVYRKRIIRRKHSEKSATSISALNKIKEIKNAAALVGGLDLSNKSFVEKLPYSFVDEKPSFVDCSSSTIDEQDQCFKEKLRNHIKRNFKYPENSYNKSIQGRVLVQFVITETGNITDIITRGPLKGNELETEAKRIIEKLPKLSPGKVNGTTVKVKYGIPISFRIPGREPSNIKKKQTEDVVFDEVINFNSVNSIPLFKSCQNKSSEEDKLNCFNESVKKHVQKYFSYPEKAAKKRIEGRVYAYFVIDKEGDVVNVKTRGPKGGELLEEATKRIIKKLPKFIPGSQNGQSANVKHMIPISFKLN